MAGCACVPEDTTDGKSTTEVDPEPAVSFGSTQHAMPLDNCALIMSVTPSSGCWAGTSVLRNNRRLQAAIGGLYHWDHGRRSDNAPAA